MNGDLARLPIQEFDLMLLTFEQGGQIDQQIR
jgi:hypothetical protein